MFNSQRVEKRTYGSTAQPALLPAQINMKTLLHMVTKCIESTSNK